MELIIAEVIKKLLAVILAAFMPLSATAPAIANAAKSQTTITVPPVAFAYDEDATDEEEELVEYNADEVPSDGEVE